MADENFQFLVKAVIDAKDTQAQLAAIKNLSLKISKLDLDQSAIENLKTQLTKNGIDVRLVLKDDAAFISQANQIGQRAGRQIGQQIQTGINGAVQKVDFQKIFTAGKSGINNVSKDVERYFQGITNAMVSVQETIGQNSNLTGFTVQLKNASGVIENLRYTLKDTEDGLQRFFEYTGGSINDNGVVKQITAIESKAESLSIKLESLKSKYSDVNAPRAIKDESHISSLADQYNKVAQAIENVRNSDGTTFSAMTANAEKEIAVLNSMVSAFQNAENVATKLKSTDITSALNLYKNKLETFKADAGQFSGMTTTIKELDAAIRNVADKSSLNDFIDKLRVAESELQKVKQESANLSVLNGIKDSIGTNGDVTTKIQTISNNFSKLGLSADEVKAKMRSVNEEVSVLKSLVASDASSSEIIDQFNRVNIALAQTNNDLKTTRSEYALLATEQQRLTLANNIEAWNQKNTAATRETIQTNEQYINSLRNLNTQITKVEFAKIKVGFQNAENSMRGIGRLGASFSNQIQQGINSFRTWLSATTLVMAGISTIRQIPSAINELDTSLVDLAKTTTMSKEELNQFYYTSNDVAKQMGVTTNEIISQASAWSRLGYSSAEAATKMAQYSAQFKLISPGMTMDQSTSGLVSIMKAFDIEVDDVVDGIMSKINTIGNKFALSNTNIVNMLQSSVSAMAEGNNTLEETIALETAAYEITQDENTGVGFKTVSQRLRGINEETEELDDSLKTIQGDLYDLTGVSVMQDADTYKSTYQILKEISEVWDTLSDKNQAEALELMFGKHRSNIGAAVIKNFSAAERALDEMSNSAGSAEAEMSVMFDSIDYKANKLKETGVSIAQNLLQRDEAKFILDSLTKVAEIFDHLTEKAGILKTLFAGVGIYAGIKNNGLFKTSQNDRGGTKLGLNVQGFRNLFSKSSSTLSNDDITAIGNYNAELTRLNRVTQELGSTMSQEQIAQQAFSTTMTQSSSAAQNMVLAANNGTVSLARLTSGSKLAAAALGMLRVAGSMVTGVLIGIAIQKVAEGINNLIHASENARAKSEELTSAWKTSDSELADNISKYQELSEKLKDNSLSTEEVTAAKEELSSIQDALVEKYGVEAASIDLVNGKYDEQISKLTELSKQKASEFVGENYNGHKEDVSYLNDSHDLSVALPNKVSNDSMRKLRQILEKDEYSNISEYLFSNGGRLELTGTREEIRDTLTNLFNDLNDEYIKSSDEGIARLKETVSKALGKDLINADDIAAAKERNTSYARAEIASNDDASDSYNKLNDAILNYNKTLEDGNPSAEAEDNLLTAKQAAEDATSGIENADDVLQELYNTLSSKAPVDLKVKLGLEGANELKREYARELFATKNQFTDDGTWNDWFSENIRTQDEIDAWKEIRESCNSAAEAKAKYLNQFTSKKAKDSSYFGDTLSKLSEEKELVDEVLNQNSTLTLGQYDELISYSSEYANCLKMEGENVTLDKEAVEKLNQARKDQIQTQLKEARATKRAEYHELANKLEDLTNDYRVYDEAKAGTIATTLEEMDAISSEIAKYELLEQQLLGTSNAFDEYKSAQGDAGTGKNYDTAMDARMSIKEGFESGKLGTPEFEAAVKLLVPEDIIDEGVASIRDYYNQSVKRYFSIDDDDKETITGLENFINDSIKNGLMDGSVEDFTVSENKHLEDFCDTLGLTKESVLSLFGELETYGYGQNFDWTADLIDGVDQSYTQLEQLEAQLLSTKADMVKDGSWGTDAENTSEILTNLTKIKAEKNSLAEQMTSGILNFDDDSKQLEDLRLQYDALISEINQTSDSDNKIKLQADADEVLEQIDDIEAKITEPTEMNIQISEDYIQGQIDKYQLAVENADFAALIGVDQSEAEEKVADFKGQLEDINNIKYNQQNEELGTIGTKVDELKQKVESPKELNVQTSNALTKLFSVNNVINSIRRNAENPVTFSVTTVQNTITRKTGSGKLLGTLPNLSARALAMGTLSFRPGTVNHAYAQGMIGRTQKTENALVGELGTEIVVLGNRWWTVGDDGAEFQRIPAGAIVFNHKQSEELLKNGKATSGGGRAHLEGTAHVGVSGGSGINIHNGSNYSGSSSSKSDSSSKSSNSDDSDDSDDTAEELEETLNDWIERLLKALERTTSNLLSQAERVLVNPIKRVLMDNAMSNMLKQMDANIAAYERYMQEANNVGLSQDYIQKIQDGLIDLENISDEELNDQISSYKEMYDKAIDCADSIEELRDKIRDTAESFAQIEADRLSDSLDKLSDSLTILEKRYDNSVSVADKNSNLRKQTNNSVSVWQESVRGLSNISASLTNVIQAMDGAFYQQVNAGEKIDTSDLSGDLLVNAEKYNALLDTRNETLQKVMESYEDMTAAIRENAKAQADNIQAALDNTNALYESQVSRFQSQIDKLETLGDTVGSSYYTKQSEIYQREYNALSKTNSELQRYLDQQVKAGNIIKYSDDWYDLVQQIYDNADAMDSFQKNIIEAQKAINQLKITNLERLISAFTELNSEVDFLKDVLSSKDLVNTDTGEYTDEGFATAGLLAQQREMAIRNAEEYKRAIAQLDADAAKTGANILGNSGYNDYIDQRNDLMDKYRDYISEVYDYEGDMVDLVNKKIDAQIDLYEEIISKRKEAIEKLAEEKDYAEDIEDKTKKKLLIERQIRALEGNNSDYAMKRRKELLQELEDANKDLQDTQDDKAKDNKLDALDKDLENFKKSSQEYVKDTQRVLSDLTNQINENADTISGALNKISEETGYQISDTVLNAWTSAGNAVSDFSLNLQKIFDNQSNTTTALSNISAAYDQVAKSAEAAAKQISNATTAQNNSVTKANNPSTDEDFLRSTYKELLGRNIDDTGLNHWMNQLKSGMSRDDVRNAIINSAEYQNPRIVKALYQELLGRDADATGLKEWTSKLNGGMSKEDVRNAIMASEEYKKKHGIVDAPAQPAQSTTPEQQTVSNANSGGKVSDLSYTLAKGQKSDDVKLLQNALNQIIGAGLAVDGSFGGATLKAVKEFQRRFGLDADGRVGPATRKKFREMGFHTGGIASLVHDIGEDGIAFVKNNEMVITPENSRDIKSILDNLPTVNEILVSSGILLSKSTEKQAQSAYNFSKTGENIKIEVNEPLVSVGQISDEAMLKKVERAVDEKLNDKFGELRQKINRNYKK